MKWFKDEFFGFIHFGPNTFSGREWDTGIEEPEMFNPTDLDTKQWCRLMNEAGMKRVVMVAKHHEGFSLWQTRYTEHSVASSPWKEGEGDVVRELGQNGCIESYHADISANGETWKAVHTGSFGNIRNNPSVRTVLFDSQAKGRYLRLSELTPLGGEDKVGAGRIEVLP